MRKVLSLMAVVMASTVFAFGASNLMSDSSAGQAACCAKGACACACNGDKAACTCDDGCTCSNCGAACCSK